MGLTIYDQQDRTNAVRIVYAGAADSGRTANIVAAKRINGLADHCRLESVTPGRTQQSDHLLARADAMVFVVDSSPEGLRRAALAHTVLARQLGAARATVPLVVQANKQDLTNAAPVDFVRLALGLSPETAVVPASALVGRGVRETLALVLDAAARRDSRATPPLPDTTAPVRDFWPHNCGADVLEKIATYRRHRTDQRVDARGIDFVYEAGPYLLTTTRARRFVSAEAGKAALNQLARKKNLLGGLFLEGTVLALQPADDGSVWLWTITPRRPTLRDQMEHADRLGDQLELALALARFARAAVAALALARRRGLSIEPDPRNFAAIGESIVYINGEIEIGAVIPNIGRYLMQPVFEYEHQPAAVECYLAAVAEAFEQHLDAHDVDALSLAASLASLPPISPTSWTARAQLIIAVERVAHQPPSRAATASSD